MPARSSVPALSILLPFRDAADTLADCLASIQAQTFRDYELIAIDDHSRDTSNRLVESFARKDPRIRLIPATGNGLVDALNQGLKTATTNLVARMDADDLMLPERLQLQQEYMRRHPRTAVLGSRVTAFANTPVSEGFQAYLRWQNACITPDRIANDIYFESPLAHPSVMLRRDNVLAAGGYQNGLFPEDYELWLRLHRNGEILAKLPDTLLRWRDEPNRTSRTDPRCSRNAFDRLRAQYLSIDPRLNDPKRSLVVWGAGRKTRRRAEHLLNRGFDVKAWVDVDAKKIGNRINGVPVVAPDWLEQQEKPLVLCYVTSHGVREQVENFLLKLGYEKGGDFLHVG